MPRTLSCECGECPTCLTRARMRAYCQRHPGIQKLRTAEYRERKANGVSLNQRRNLDELALKWLQERGFR